MMARRGWAVVASVLLARYSSAVSALAFGGGGGVGGAPQGCAGVVLRAAAVQGKATSVALQGGEEPYSLFGSSDAVTSLKAQILQLGAALDRGQAYNPTSGAYYKKPFEAARAKVRALVAKQAAPLPTSLAEIDGEWELVFTTVPHGLFRSSPFFLAVQEAFEFAEEKVAFGQPKANLFFKLHELQTCSWGVSKIGRVAQTVDAEKGYLYSEFDTSIFSLTVIPILGWFKLLPTFGGAWLGRCVVTAAKASLTEAHVIEMEVDYTTSKPVEGLRGLGAWIWSVKVPVGALWKVLPWNKGRPASCSVTLRYLDGDFRVVEDIDGELFVYSRPVVARP